MKQVSTSAGATNGTTEEEMNFNKKEDLMDEFAKRWWYALPDWPPANFDYSVPLGQ